MLFSCTGVGIFNRGIESFFREAFDGLKATPGLEARLIKGAMGSETRHSSPATGHSDEYVVWCLARTGRVAPFIGRLTGRSAYAVEQWSSFPAVVGEIRRWQPHVIFYSEANLGFLLHRWRSQIGVPFGLLYSNGGPCRPPFHRYDFVHQVAPLYLAEALAAGEPTAKHFMVPYGIHVPAGAPVSDPAAKRTLRQKLGLPPDRPIVLSVGWIARPHKRMDYVIEEVARMPEPRPFLQLLGAIDDASPEIIELGNRLLGPANFSARSVPYEQVADYYRTADCFVLASLKEGFGRVYLEALIHGLPTIGHRHPVIEYVLGDAGIVADLSQPGNLAPILAQVLSDCSSGRESAPFASGSAQDGLHILRLPERAALFPASRRESVRARFSWPVLAPKYLEMFQAAATRPIPGPERGIHAASTSKPKDRP